MFTVVQFGLLVSCSRCLTYKRFRPKSNESCPHLCLQLLLSSVPVVLPNFQEELKNKFRL